jgi:hypothetical protein
MKQIPERYVELAKELARHAKICNLSSCSMILRPGILENDWDEVIQVAWKQGRHGEDNNQLTLTSTVNTHTTLDDPKEKNE